ncbi:MAG: sugar nucleotide-binding protein [Pseudobacteriovorax sp.]|nr:sugar nucleotide-binding protein [Pseudobacteriovorax sp.]
MKKVVIFGAGGAVGTAFQNFLRQHQGYSCIPWDRHKIPLTNFSEISSKLETLKPDFVFNFAVASSPNGSSEDAPIINVDFPELLAKKSIALGFRLIHTSTVMVFPESQNGPYFPDTVPNPTEGYGLDKRMAEQKIQATKSPHAIIARLGWQIGSKPGSNNMVDFLTKAHQQGPIKASRHWFTSCSHLSDTIEALFHLKDREAGIYHIDANRDKSFYEIALQLRSRLNKPEWVVEPTDEPIYNQIMKDERIKLPLLF